MTESDRRTVLVLTYEYPPSAGGGVQRVAKLTRYLPEHGFDPVVLAAEPVSGRPQDEELAAEVADVPETRLPARNVSAGFARLLAGPKRLAGSGVASGAHADVAASEAATGARARGRAGSRIPLSTRLSRWVEFDDASRWSNAAVRVGADLVRTHDCAAVVASGPPFSTLAAGAWIANTTGVPFVADMRDPWLENASAYWPTRWHRRRAQRVAVSVLGSAAAVVAVSEPIAEEAATYGARTLRVIPNGFDGEDMVPREVDPSAPLRLAFMGTFYAATDPTDLLTAFAEAAERNAEARDAQLDIVGPERASVRATVERLGISDRVRFLGYLSHSDALRVIAAADAGIVLVSDVPGSQAVYTAKLFEYLGMRMPVLAMVPEDGAAASLVRRARAGWVVPTGDVEEAVATIARMASAKSGGGLDVDMDDEVVRGLERREQAGEFAAVLRGVIE